MDSMRREFRAGDRVQRKFNRDFATVTANQHKDGGIVAITLDNGAKTAVYDTAIELINTRSDDYWKEVIKNGINVAAMYATRDKIKEFITNEIL